MLLPTPLRVSLHPNLVLVGQSKCTAHACAHDLHVVHAQRAALGSCQFAWCRRP